MPAYMSSLRTNRYVRSDGPSQASEAFSKIIQAPCGLSLARTADCMGAIQWQKNVKTAENLLNACHVTTLKEVDFLQTCHSDKPQACRTPQVVWALVHP